MTGRPGHDRQSPALERTNSRLDHPRVPEKKSLKKFWPWLLPLVISLWLIGAVSELWDARLLENEGMTVTGTITSAAWHQRRAGRMLGIDVEWRHAGRSYHGPFSLPSQAGLEFADQEGRVMQPRIGVRFARSNPQVAALVILPPDPAWVSMMVAGVGFCVVSGITGFFIYQRVQSPKESQRVNAPDP